MRKELEVLVTNNKSLALAGMCKNAGKTTVLNCIIEALNKKEYCLGMTSIGRDGESVDVVTGTYKPGIYVQEGTILATASSLLKNCDITKEILKTTGIYTPLGEVVIVRALSDGSIDLAGPSMNTQLTKVGTYFKDLQVDKVLIDGAISRKSLCSKSVADTVILCSGASLHRNIDVVMKQTKYVSDLLRLKKPEQSEINIGLESISKNEELALSKGKYLFLGEGGEIIFPKQEDSLVNLMANKNYHNYKYIYMNGAMNDVYLKTLLMSNVSLSGKCFIVKDSSKILLSQDIYDKLKIKGAQFCVTEELELLGITINPFSAYGNHFDKAEFYEKAREQIGLPIFNVMEE